MRERIAAYPGGLYTFVKGVQRKDKLTPSLHLPFCNFIQLHPWNGGPRLSHRKVAYKPREHFKSTICSEGLPLHLLATVDRNMSILIVSAKIDNAEKWLSSIKETIEYNDVFKWLYPEIRRGPKWDQQQITITRDRGHGSPQASITAGSIREGLASQHYDYIICDDLVNEQVAESDTEMEKAVRLYHALEEILKGWHDSKGFLVVGTPWGREDVLHEALEEESRGMRYKWGIGVLGDFEISESLAADHPEIVPKVKQGEPILPSQCDWERLEHIKNQSLEKYYLNYLCKPWDDGRNGFDLTCVGDYAWLPDGSLDCACHPHHRHHLSEGSTVAVSDPAYTKDKAGCESAILIGSLQPCGCRFLLFEKGWHIQPTEYVEKACEVANKYRTWLDAFGIEAEALQLSLKQWLDEKADKGDFPIEVRIHELKTRNRAKDQRIANAQPAVNRGQWHKLRSMHLETGLWKQLYQWPFSRKRDRADAFAYFEDMWAAQPPKAVSRESAPMPWAINAAIEAQDMAMFAQEEL